MSQIFAPHITDIHTHRLDARDAIISVTPDVPRRPDLNYSVGIHPWGSAEATEADVEAVRQAISEPNVLAVGECGLDTLRGAPIDRQLSLLEAQAKIAEDAHKPLILHIVKAWDQLLALKKQLRPTSPWIIHGFRGGPQQAQQLVAAGLYLSLGTRHNPDVVATIPADRLFRETD